MYGDWNSSEAKIKEEPGCETDGNNEMEGLTEIDYAADRVLRQKDCDSKFSSNVSRHKRHSSEPSFAIAMNCKERKSEEVEIGVKECKSKDDSEIEVKECKLEVEGEIEVRHKEVHIKQEQADQDEIDKYLRDVLYADHEIKEEMVIGPEVLHETVTSTSRMCSASPHSHEKRHEQRALSSHKPLNNSGKDQIIRKPHLNQHQDIVEKPFTCDICQKRFKCKSNLKIHKRDHTGKRKLKCDICEKRFRYMSALKSHQRVHTGERPFPCDICERRFNQKRDLIVHQRVHTGDRPFSCDVCGKRFKFIGNLKAHQLLHTGEMPFLCDVCEKRFCMKARLTLHQRVHTGQRLFPCDICEKSFGTKTKFTVHRRCHTTERPFPCDICEKRFKTKKALTAHLHSKLHLGKANPTKSCDV